MYEIYLRVMRRIGHYRWFSLSVKHVGTRVDRALIHASRGRLSLGGPEMPTMLLTTKGKRQRANCAGLLRARRHESRGRLRELGLEAASSWPRNLLADPKARIEIEGTSATYLSRPATEEEVARNMPRLTEMWPAHDTYLKRSGVRQVFVFEPVGGPT